MPDQPVRRIGSRTDLPLVTTGIEQAQRLAHWFTTREITFDRICAAPLVRTRQTADLIVSRQNDGPAIEHPMWLSEIDHGVDENMLESAVRRRVGEEALRLWDCAGIPPEGWLVDVVSRIKSWQTFFNECRNMKPCGNFLCVTSSGVARFALLCEPNLHRQTSELASLKLRTGALGRILLDTDFGNLDAWDVRP